jgi:hypothetical protein
MDYVCSEMISEYDFIQSYKDNYPPQYGQQAPDEKRYIFNLASSWQACLPLT